MAKPGLIQNACIILVVCTATAIAASAQTFTTIFSFDSTNGANPSAGLIRATDGNFYGTTKKGGANGWGTVFKITPEGTITTLHSFDYTDGAYPSGRLIQAADGNFYGTTEQDGGDGDYGTVFKITPGGRLTNLHTFRYSDGAYPFGGLIQATDGKFYGTTSDGGANFNGTVFKITSGGILTTLHSFGSAEGAFPWAGLIQASDGNFYGTTLGGGAFGDGTVFQMTSGGTLTTLHSFDPYLDGYHPQAGLIQATNGNFYGTTSGDARPSCRYPLGCGTVFELTPGGVLTTLHSFDTTDGHYPIGGVIQSSDGNFYGTTSAGASWRCQTGCGTVFEITAGSTLTLHRFQSTDGAYPSGRLIQTTDGAFYGTTVGGGASSSGTIFRFVVAPAVTLSSTSLRFGNQILDQTSTAKKVTVKNSGTAPLMVKRISIDGTFAISANTCGAVLDIGKTCALSITFTPTVLGKVAGTLTLSDDASNSPQMVLLWGTGVEPATLMPLAAAYASQVVGTTSMAKTFTLTNYQSVELTGIKISTSGDFAVSATTCTTSLAAKGRCSIDIVFAPKATGARAGKLSVSNSASNSPQASSLNGTGK